MKLIISLFFCFAIINVGFAQEQLYYFINPSDSMVGVKNSFGNVIVPAKYNFLYQRMEHPDTPITEATIYMLNWEGNNLTPCMPALSAGDVYSRTGKLLYHPMQFDNGEDVFTEGLTRCVNSDHKAGFANADGKIVIKPQYDWVSEFNYGYAFACNGCTLDLGKDPEHTPIKYCPGADTFYINKAGKRVATSKVPAGPKDQKTNAGYLPYPFSYTVAEQQLVDSFYQLEVISRIHFMNVHSQHDENERRLQFEITQRPIPGNNFFVITGYTRIDGHYRAEEQNTFFIDKTGNWYAEAWSEGRIPFHAWLTEQLQECKEYFKEHPDAPYKFDVDKYLKNSSR